MTPNSKYRLVPSAIFSNGKFEKRTALKDLFSMIPPFAPLPYGNDGLVPYSESCYTSLIQPSHQSLKNVYPVLSLKMTKNLRILPFYIKLKYFDCYFTLKIIFPLLVNLRGRMVSKPCVVYFILQFQN